MTTRGPDAGTVLVVGPPGADLGALGRMLSEAGVPALEPGPDAVGGPDGVRAPDRLLHELRATALAPPELDRLETELDPAVARERTGSDATGSTVAWVDPTNGLLLPLLRRGPTPPVAVVLAWRSPEAAVAALAAEGVGPAHALALWEAHLVHALRGAAGLPLVGLDLERAPEVGVPLAALLTELGVTVPDEVVDRWTATATELAGDAPPEPSGAPEVTALTDAIRARLAPVLAAAAGAHPAWDPPDGLRLGAVSEALLASHRAAHRSALDAVAAWSAAHDAEAAARDAKDAVEREHRELVGPDPMHYRELRRELWRLRDEFAGIVAGRTNYHVAWMRADAERLTAEQRGADLLARLEWEKARYEGLEAEVRALSEARSQRDAMLRSTRWRIGGMFTRPFARLRRPTSPR